jgi:GNAT superfamily N-acetyltransferase
MMIEVRRVESEVLQGVRHRVLWPHLENSQQAIIDIDHSTGAIHLAAFYNGEVVGVASLFNQKCKRMPEIFTSLKVYRLRAMGVLEYMRGGRVGAFILEKAITEMKVDGVEVVWCDAREVACGFYEKLGFKFVRQKNGDELEPYLVRNVGLHKLMFKRL